MPWGKEHPHQEREAGGCPFQMILVWGGIIGLSVLLILGPQATWAAESRAVPYEHGPVLEARGQITTTVTVTNAAPLGPGSPPSRQPNLLLRAIASFAKLMGVDDQTVETALAFALDPDHRAGDLVTLLGGEQLAAAWDSWTEKVLIFPSMTPDNPWGVIFNLLLWVFKYGWAIFLVYYPLRARKAILRLRRSGVSEEQMTDWDIIWKGQGIETPFELLARLIILIAFTQLGLELYEAVIRAARFGVHVIVQQLYALTPGPSPGTLLWEAVANLLSASTVWITVVVGVFVVYFLGVTLWQGTYRLLEIVFRGAKLPWDVGTGLGLNRTRQMSLSLTAFLRVVSTQALLYGLIMIAPIIVHTPPFSFVGPFALLAVVYSWARLPDTIVGGAAAAAERMAGEVRGAPPPTEAAPAAPAPSPLLAGLVAGTTFPVVVNFIADFLDRLRQQRIETVQESEIEQLRRSLATFRGEQETLHRTGYTVTGPAEKGEISTTLPVEMAHQWPAEATVSSPVEAIVPAPAEPQAPPGSSRPSKPASPSDAPPPRKVSRLDAFIRASGKTLNLPAPFINALVGLPDPLVWAIVAATVVGTVEYISVKKAVERAKAQAGRLRATDEKLASSMESIGREMMAQVLPKDKQE